MSSQVFPPDDAGGATIHDEMGPLINKGNVVKRCLGKEGGEGEEEDEQDAEKRKRMLFQMRNEK